MFQTSTNEDLSIVPLQKNLQAIVGKKPPPPATKRTLPPPQLDVKELLSFGIPWSSLQRKSTFHLNQCLLVSLMIVKQVEEIKK